MEYKKKRERLRFYFCICSFFVSCFSRIAHQLFLFFCVWAEVGVGFLFLRVKKRESKKNCRGICSIGRAYDTARKSRTSVTCCLGVRKCATTEVILITMHDNRSTNDRHRATQLNQGVLSFKNGTSFGAGNIAQVAHMSIYVAGATMVLAKWVEVPTSSRTALRKIAEFVNVKAMVSIVQSREDCFVSRRLTRDLYEFNNAFHAAVCFRRQYTDGFQLLHTRCHLSR